MDATQARIIVVAGALVPPGWLPPEALSARLPRLARLAVHAEAEALPPQAGTLPSELAHDRWLRARLAAQGIAPGAMAAVRRLARYGDDLAGWLLEPAHFHLGRDHVVLVAGAMHDLSAAQAEALVGAIGPVLADDGLELTILDPRTWLLRELAGDGTATPLQLQAASADAAAGRSVEGYLPEGPDARRYRRVLNGVQMTWHEHPVNQEREARGALPVNGIWLSGPVTPQALGAWRAQLERGAASVDDSLLQPRLQDDREAWLEALGALEDRLVPALAAHGEQAVLLCGDEEARWLRPGRPGVTARAGAAAARVVASLRGRFRRDRSPAGASVARHATAIASHNSAAAVGARPGAVPDLDPLAAVFVEATREAGA